MNSENSQLVLSTLGLPAEDINTSKTVMTWRRLDLKQVMGAFYDKYEKFNLCLVSYSTMGANVGIDATESNILVYMQGIPFVNSTYDCVERCNTNYMYITPLIIPANASITLIPNGCCFTFDKSKSIVDITITLAQGSTNAPNLASPLVNHCFSFEIYGVNK